MLKGVCTEVIEREHIWDKDLDKFVADATMKIYFENHRSLCLTYREVYNLVKSGEIYIENIPDGYFDKLLDCVPLVFGGEISPEPIIKGSKKYVHFNFIDILNKLNIKLSTICSLNFGRVNDFSELKDWVNLGDYSVCIVDEYGLNALDVFVKSNDTNTVLCLSEHSFVYKKPLVEDIHKLVLKGIKFVDIEVLTSRFIVDSSFSAEDYYNAKGTEKEYSIINSGEIENIDKACKFYKILQMNIDNRALLDISSTLQYFYTLREIYTEDVDCSCAENIIQLVGGRRYLVKADFSGLKNLEISSTRSMFSMCENLKDLVLPDFSKSIIIDITDMFMGCQKLEKIDISTIDMNYVAYSERAFNCCESLRDLRITGHIGKTIFEERWKHYNLLTNATYGVLTVEDCEYKQGWDNDLHINTNLETFCTDKQRVVFSEYNINMHNVEDIESAYSKLKLLGVEMTRVDDVILKPDAEKQEVDVYAHIS